MRGLKALLRICGSYLFWFSLLFLVHSVLGVGWGVGLILFWDDRWLEDSPLCSLFPHLYHLSFMRGCSVASVMPSLGNEFSLFLCLRRSLSDRETVDLVALLELLEDFVVSLGRWDARLWSPNVSEGFSCKSFFSCLVDLLPSRFFVSLHFGRLRYQRK